MARPTKKGLDYFSLDCTMDSKLEYIEAIHGLNGFGIIVKIWQSIYREEGYFIKWDKRTKFLFCKQNQVEIEKVESVLKSCFEEEIFNQEKFNEYKILTSEGVQKRYVKVCKDAKRKDVTMDSKYTIKGLIPELMKLNPELIALTPEESTQSKVKDNKEDKSKVKDNNLGVDKSSFSTKKKRNNSSV